MTKKWILALALLLVSVGFIEVAVAKKSSAAKEDLTALSVEERYIDSDDSKIFCRKVGKGKPLVVIHGGPGMTQDYLLPQMGKLAEHNFVIFYDQRGCGRSTGEIHPDTLTVLTLVKDLEMIRKAYKLGKISLFGHSWGGFLAILYAIEHPEAVDKLVLSNSQPASSDDYALFDIEVTRRLAPIQAELAEIQSNANFQEGDPDLNEWFFRILLRAYCHNPEHVNLLNVKMTPTAAINCWKVHAILGDNPFRASFTLHPLLKNLRIPTLIIHGDNDPVPKITAQNIHRSIQDSKYVEIKNCGHFPFIEQPEEYFRVLKNFLN